MSKKIDLSNCGTGRDFGEYAQEHGAEVHKNGSYLVVENKRGTAYVPDSGRAMPKPSRQLILAAFKLLGLATVVAAILIANGWMPW